MCESNDLFTSDVYLCVFCNNYDVSHLWLQVRIYFIGLGTMYSYSVFCIRTGLLMIADRRLCRRGQWEVVILRVYKPPCLESRN